MNTVSHLAPQAYPAIGRTKEFKKGHIFYTRGEKATLAYKVHSGYVLLYVETEDDRRSGIGLVKPGETFGEELVKKTLRRHNAMVYMNATVEFLLPTEENTERILQDSSKRADNLEELWVTKKAKHRVPLICARYPELILGAEMITTLSGSSRKMVSLCIQLDPTLPVRRIKVR